MSREREYQYSVEGRTEPAPSGAQANIDSRSYNKPEDIMKVKETKQKPFDQINDMITVL